MIKKKNEKERNYRKNLMSISLHSFLKEFKRTLKIYNQSLLTIAPILCKLKMVIVWF